MNAQRLIHHIATAWIALTLATIATSCTYALLIWALNWSTLFG